MDKSYRQIETIDSDGAEDEATPVYTCTSYPSWKENLWLVSKECYREAKSMLQRTIGGPICVSTDTVLLTGYPDAEELLQVDLRNVKNLALTSHLWYLVLGKRSQPNGCQFKFLEHAVSDFEVKELTILVGWFVGPPKVTTRFTSPEDDPAAYDLKSGITKDVKSVWSAKEQELMDAIRSKRRRLLAEQLAEGEFYGISWTKLT